MGIIEFSRNYFLVLFCVTLTICAVIENYTMIIFLKHFVNVESLNKSKIFKNQLANQYANSEDIFPKVPAIHTDEYDL